MGAFRQALKDEAAADVEPLTIELKRDASPEHVSAKPRQMVPEQWIARNPDAHLQATDMLRLNRLSPRGVVSG